MTNVTQILCPAHESCEFKDEELGTLILNRQWKTPCIFIYRLLRAIMLTPAIFSMNSKNRAQK